MSLLFLVSKLFRAHFKLQSVQTSGTRFVNVFLLRIAMFLKEIGQKSRAKIKDITQERSDHGIPELIAVCLVVKKLKPFVS